MKQIDVTFFDKYKNAEKICKEICGEKGVSAYIENMENKAQPGRALVADWDKYFKTLKHLRWLRNQIAHENEEYEVTQQDIKDIDRFLGDLMAQNDPLSLLYKESKRRAKTQRSRGKNGQKRDSGPVYFDPKAEEQSRKNLTALKIILLLLIVTAAIIGAFLFLNK